MNARDVPADKLLALANAHVKRFGIMVHNAREGARGIRLDECEHYLYIWSDLQQKVNNAIVSREEGVLIESVRVDLDEEEENEVQDAIDCGDYDQLLGL